MAAPPSRSRCGRCPRPGSRQSCWVSRPGSASARSVWPTARRRSACSASRCSAKASARSPSMAAGGRTSRRGRSQERAVVSEADVERLAALLGLPIEPDSLAAVAENLTGLLTAARLLAELHLPDDVEPAPIFRPCVGGRGGADPLAPRRL